MATRNAAAQPVITLQPTNQLNCALGTNVLLRVTAQDSRPLHYQWRLNGVNFPGATNSSFSISSLNASNCGNYSVAVSDLYFAVNSAVARVTPAVTLISSNDNFSSRGTLTPAAAGVVRSSNTNATVEKNEVKHTYNAGGKSIWFKWTPTVRGIVTFTTAGSGFDTIMAAYTGNKVDGLKVVPSSVSDDDGGGYLTSKISFNAVAGTEYEIGVDGFSGASGDVVLSWSENFTADLLPVIKAMPKTANSVPRHSKVNLSFACDPSKEGWMFNGQPLSDSSTNYSITDVDDKVVGKYVATATSSGGHKNSTVPASIQINTREDGSTDPQAQALDKFQDSAALVVRGATARAPVGKNVNGITGGGDSRGYSLSQVFSTSGATKEPGEPNHCGQVGGASVWFSYSPPASGNLRIDTEGSSYNTILAVYVGPGDSFATLTNVGCAYTTNWTTLGQPSVYIPNVAPGVTYYIVVDGTDGAFGVAHLNINMGSPVAIVSGPRNAMVPPGSNTTFTATASGSTPVCFQWQFNGVNIAQATNSTLVVTNVQPTKIGAYTVVVSNGVSASVATAQLGILPPPSPLFNQVTRSGHALKMQFNGVSGHTYFIQTSTNLINWSTVATNVAGSSPIGFTNLNTADCVGRFYRVFAQ